MESAKSVHNQYEESTEEYLKRLNKKYKVLPIDSSISKPPSKEDIEYVKQILNRKNNE